jgi:Zn-dependent protease with chaperone function
MNELVAIPTTLPVLARFYPRADLVWIAVQLFRLAIPLFFLFTGFGARLRSFCQRLTRANFFWTLVLFAASYLVLASLIAMPLGYYAEIAFPRSWGAPVPSLANWLSGGLSNLIGEVVIAGAVLWIPYALIVRRPRLWWFYASLIAIPAFVAGLLFYQLVLYPSFAHLHPLTDQALAARIDALAARCGEPHIPVLVGGWDDTVIGIGPTAARLVISEQSLHDLTPPELIAAVAHELKHYLFDGWEKIIPVTTTLILVGLWLVSTIGRVMIRRFHRAFGFSDLADPASLPIVIFILMAAWLFAGLPIFNAIQRHIEFEADRFALELTHKNHGQGLLQLRNSKYKLNEEYLFYRIWRDNHPSQSERVHFANTYRPWADGKPLVYANICKLPSNGE